MMYFWNLIQLNHTRLHPKLPNVCVKDHSTIQKSHVLKKGSALKCILSRRRNEKIVDNEQMLENDERYIVLPDGILPIVIGANELKYEQLQVTKQAYEIMKWWRCTGSNNVDTGTPRYK